VRLTPRLIRAEAREGYFVRLQFSDGTTADVNLERLVGSGPVFEPLRDREYFARLRASREANTVVWPNGADIAPETLYAEALKASAVS
jgi:uncharacterized protein DUF2442